MCEDKKDIEIVNDDGSALNISPVYNHISSEKPKCDDEKPKNIIVPKSHKNEEKK